MLRFLGRLTRFGLSWSSPDDCRTVYTLTETPQKTDISDMPGCRLTFAPANAPVASRLQSGALGGASLSVFVESHSSRSSMPRTKRSKPVHDQSAPVKRVRMRSGSFFITRARGT